MDLITRSLKVEEITSEVVKKLIDKVIEDYKLKEEEVEYVLKGIPGTECKVDEGERSVISYINTAVRDRDNEIIVPKGAVLKDYKANPVVMWAHNYSMLPIGKNLWIKNDAKGLIAKTKYAKHEKAEEIYQYRKDGFPLAESIGFIPLKVIYPEDVLDEDLEKLGLDPEEARKARRIYTKWILLEYSDVPVPANPEALQMAISKGLISKEEAKEYEFEDEDSLVKLWLPDGKGGTFEVAREDISNELYNKLISETPPDQDDPDVKEFLQKRADEQKAKYNCECIKCGHKLTTDKHCNDIKCPKCGGKMRRLERPGPGRSADEAECVECDLGKEYEIGKDIEFSEDEYIDKSLVEKPYENEHACRLLKPGDFDRFARKNCYVKHDGKCIDCIFGIKENKSKLQSMRYPKDIWTVASAKTHCKSKEGTFEAAKALEPTMLSIEVLDNTRKLFETLKLDAGIAITCTNPESADAIEAFSEFLLERLAEKDAIIELEEAPESEAEAEEIEIEGSPDLSDDRVTSIISEALAELVAEIKPDVSDLVDEVVRKLQGKVV